MVGNTCAVAACKNYSAKDRAAKKSIVYFRFPKDATIRTEWIQKCKRIDKINPENGRICSEHFTWDDYEDNIKARLMNIVPKKLKSTAVPSLNLLPKTNTLLKGKVNPLPTCEVFIKEEPLENLPSTSQESEYYILQRHCDAITAENESLKISLEESKTEISILKNRIIEYQTFINNQKHDSNIAFTKKVTEHFSEFLTPNQIKVVLKKQTKARWDPEEMARAFTIRYFSQRCYKYLRESLKYPLPGVSTLQKWASNIQLSNGLLKDVLTILDTSGKSKTDLQRLTVLLFDEIKVASTYEYDLKADNVIGPHTYMQVVMARGLFDNWKQPVYIKFDTKMTKKLLYEVIISLHTINYKVVACVSGCDSGNQSLWTELGISINNTSYSHPLTQENIYFFPDAPHILKQIRNWLIDTGFTLSDGKIICKTPLEELITTVDTEISSYHKLQDFHLTCNTAQRQNVRLAAQLLSDTTATALKTYGSSNIQQAHDLGDFIHIIRTWFDIMSSNAPTTKIPSKQPYGKNLESQIKTINTVKEMFNELHCTGKNTQQMFQKEIIISCSSMEAIYTDLVEKYKIFYISTHRLNQNIFSQIRKRSGSHDLPSPLDTIHRVRMMFLGKNEENVEPKTNLQQNDGLQSEQYVDPGAPCQPEIKYLPILEPHLTENEFSDNTSNASSTGSPTNALVSEEDGFIYIAGYLARKHQADFPNLGSYTSENESISLQTNSMPTWVKSLSFGALIQPSNSWLDSIKVLEEYFKKLHEDSFRFKNKIISRTADFLSQHVPSIDKILIESYSRQRVLMRMKFLIAIKNENLAKRKAIEDSDDTKRTIKKIKIE